MRRIISCFAVAVISVACAAAQAGTASQTARQALMEMFFSKTPGTFLKHLPAATRNTLEKTGALASLEQYSQMASQIQTQQNNVEMFETGSVMLSGHDPKTNDKFEILVENDALRGDLDEIEIAFRLYKNGEPQRTPFMPRMTFSMKQEARVWKLNDISLTVHLPLADPDLLKAFSDAMKQTPGVAGGAALQQAAMSAPPQQTEQAGSDATVINAMRTILGAEVTYAASYPSVGYTCSLSSLDGFGGGERNEHQAMLINSGLASGKRYGFVFTLSGCGGSPATAYHLTAAPNANVTGRKAFCADQSAVIRSSDDANPSTCLERGTPVQ